MPAWKNNTFKFPSNPVTYRLLLDQHHYYKELKNKQSLARWFIILLLYWIREIPYLLLDENYFKKLWNTKDSDTPCGHVRNILKGDVFLFSIKQDLCRIIHLNMCLLYWGNNNGMFVRLCLHVIQSLELITLISGNVLNAITKFEIVYDCCLCRIYRLQYKPFCC